MALEVGVGLFYGVTSLLIRAFLQDLVQRADRLKAHHRRQLGLLQLMVNRSSLSYRLLALELALERGDRFGGRSDDFSLPRDLVHEFFEGGSWCFLL